MKNTFKIVLVLALCLVLVPVGFAQSGYNVGVTTSLGFINGGYITNLPMGLSFAVGTPFGYNVAGFDLSFNGVFGFYSAEAGEGNSFTPIVFGVGANALVKEMVFAEGQLGYIGAGLGTRGFAGVSLERLLKKSLGLPVNLLVGGEGFITSKAKEDGNKTYWGGLAVRAEYDF